MAKTPEGFVALTSLKQGPAGSAEALAELRRIYFKTTARTIEHDFAHAIALIKGIESEEDRQKASVFMEGINELRKEWEQAAPRTPQRPQRPKHSKSQKRPKK